MVLLCIRTTDRPYGIASCLLRIARLAQRENNLALCQSARSLFMFDPRFMLVATVPGDQTTNLLRHVTGTTDDQVVGIENALSHDVSQVPLLQHLSEVMPAADVLVGGAMLILIMLVHAAGVRAATNHVLHRSKVLLATPTRWRADVLMSSTVFMLLGLHLLEIIAWAAALVYSGLVPNWRLAGFFAGNTYTTIGYGTLILPDGWKMLAPIIAISGLFTFGWSGSVLVDLIGRCQKIKDAATSNDNSVPDRSG
jgi:hypothetical protein